MPALRTSAYLYSPTSRSNALTPLHIRISWPDSDRLFTDIESQRQRPWYVHHPWEAQTMQGSAASMSDAFC